MDEQSSGAKHDNVGNLNRHDTKPGLIAAIPQIFAAVSAASFHIVVGMCLAYPAILIPQLLEEQSARNVTLHNGISINKESASWIASVINVVTVPSALIGALLIDVLGRLHSIRLSALPTIVGWVLIAICSNMTTLIVGRILTGIAMPWGTGSGAAYITEISSPHLRGSLVSFNSLFISLGFLLMYVVGSLLHWRTAAWVCVGFTMIPVTLLTFLPESPAWLMMKNRSDQALKSLEWFNRYQNRSLTAIQFGEEQERTLLNKQKKVQATDQNLSKKAKSLLDPTCYKPLLILFGIFFFQHFTGIYMTLTYAVNFMQDVGTSINPYLASVYLGAARFGTAIFNVWLLRYFKRRHLLFVSTIGMSASMVISGMFTNWIHEGRTSHTWVAIAMPVLYVIFSAIGLLSLPFLYGSELFSHEVRGMAQSVTLSLSYALLFVALKSYFVLEDFLGGAAGLQFYFAAMSLMAFVFCYVFVPETYKKKLSEIEDYFKSHTTYLSVKNSSSYVVSEKDTRSERV